MSRVNVFFPEIKHRNAETIVESDNLIASVNSLDSKKSLGSKALENLPAPEKVANFLILKETIERDATDGEK